MFCVKWAMETLKLKHLFTVSVANDSVILETNTVPPVCPIRDTKQRPNHTWWQIKWGKNTLDNFF